MNCHIPLLTLVQLPLLSPVLSVIKYLRLPFMWRFLPASLPLKLLHPFCHNDFPHWCWQVYLTAYQGSLKWSSVNILTRQLFPLFTFGSNATFNITTFCFSASLSSSLANPLLQLSIFIKCHTGLSLRDKETIQAPTLLSIHKLSNQCVVTNCW